MKHIVIVGAGGVASYLLPPMIKTFRPESIHLVDRDILEERNLDRQMFKSHHVGKNKAECLAAMYHKFDDGRETTMDFIPEWFSESMMLPEKTDLLICCADNHRARRDVLECSDLNRIPSCIGGNEFFDSQAFYYTHEWSGTRRDPRVRYPEITTDNTGSPFRCTGAAQTAHPQLAIANFNCAARILHLLWLYHRWLPENQKDLDQEALNALPYELNNTLFGHGSP